MSSDPCALDPSSPTGGQNVQTVHDFVQGETKDGIGKLPPEVLLQIFSNLLYSDLLSVRSTQKSWQKLSQDKGLLKSIATRDFTWAPDLIQHLPPYLEITTEDRTNYSDTSTLGLYKLCPKTCNERKAVYEQMNVEGITTNYIYCENSTWKASSIVGNKKYYFLTAKTATASPTASIWEYSYDGDDGIGNDDMVLVTALSQLPPACAITLSCPSVPEDMTCPEVMGDYVATSQYSWGRLIFKHVDRELVLAVNSNCYWVVRSVVDGDVGDLEDMAKEYLWGPADLLPCVSHLRQDDWMYDDDWIADEDRYLPELEVKCATHAAGQYQRNMMRYGSTDTRASPRSSLFNQV